MHFTSSILTYIFSLIYLAGVSLAIPVPLEVLVSKPLYNSLSAGLQRREAPYKITGEECLKKHSGIKFCAMGHYLCQSKSQELETSGARMWEAIDDPEEERKCLKQGWSGNSDIARIKTN